MDLVLVITILVQLMLLLESKQKEKIKCLRNKSKFTKDLLMLMTTAKSIMLTEGNMARVLSRSNFVLYICTTGLDQLNVRDLI